MVVCRLVGFVVRLLGAILVVVRRAKGWFGWLCGRLKVSLGVLLASLGVILASFGVLLSSLV